MKFLMMILAGLAIGATQVHAEEGFGDLPPKIKKALDKDWLFQGAMKAAAKKYKSCSPYESNVSDHKAEHYENEADKEISVMYSCDESDSVDVTALYNSRTNEISNVSVSYRPCSSDMCGP